MTEPLPHWYLLGAGNMGTLAAWYLTRAGHTVSVVTNSPRLPLQKQLIFANQRMSLTLPCVSPAELPPAIKHVLVASKTPYTDSALQRVKGHLNNETQVLRFQNGVGALDGRLPSGSVMLEAITTSAVKGQSPQHTIVAENATWIGGTAQPPEWFEGLQIHWPNLHWEADIRLVQWRKLVANAVINPLTAFYDIPNGALMNDPALLDQARTLCSEADALLAILDSQWPGDSFTAVLEVIRDTADNTSSMRADYQRGATTEIEAINGWLLCQAKNQGMDLPSHRRLVEALTSTP